MTPKGLKLEEPMEQGSRQFQQKNLSKMKRSQMKKEKMAAHPNR